MQGRVLDTFWKLSRPIPGPISQAIIMGLDVSLNNTGVSILHSGKVRTFAIGKGTEVSSIERLAYYQQECRDLLDRYRPSIIMIEGYSFSSKFSRPHSIGELGGVLKLVIRSWIKDNNLDVAVYAVPPTTLKKAVRGEGKGTKKQMKEDMTAITGLTFPDDDQCDAAALALSGLVMLGPEHSILKDRAALLPNRKGSSPLEKLF